MSYNFVAEYMCWLYNMAYSMSLQYTLHEHERTLHVCHSLGEFSTNNILLGFHNLPKYCQLSKGNYMPYTWLKLQYEYNLYNPILLIYKKIPQTFP
jgi:hypothetical protein